MSDVLIEVNQLSKVFKDKKAVNDATFKIRKGEIFGLIGKNGAGKSTLLKMIAGLIHPTEGEIHLFNHAMNNNHAYFERIGLLIESPGLYPYYTGARNLELIALGYGLENKSRRIEEVLTQVGLLNAQHIKVRNYSMGMKQRLGIAAALLGSPDVLILDEPINGLDPEGIVDVRNLILELNKTGMTILISSHILEELSKVATKYAIINDGTIIELVAKDTLQMKWETRIELEIDSAQAVTPILEEMLNITKYKVLDETLVHIYDTHVEIKNLVAALARHDIAIHSVTKHKQNLEQYFLERTGRGNAGEPHA